MKRKIFLSAILAVMLLLPATARAQLTIIGNYTAGDNTLNIATHVKNGRKNAVIGISSRVAISFPRNEWKTFVAIWQKAKNTQSVSFRIIDTYQEVGTRYQSLLIVAAGPGVQFTINDPEETSKGKQGTYSFILSASDYARFDADIAKVTAYLDSN
jgi:hypothetical protein